MKNREKKASSEKTECNIALSIPYYTVKIRPRIPS
jgi:hypothetical protein